MVAARGRVFDAGLYAPITSAVATECRSAATILDAGGGPGHYLAAALDAAGEQSVGIGVDLSRYCARGAAKRHPRGVSVVADLWAGLPIRDEAVDTVLSVFAPRNVAETARVLAPGGRWIIVTPEPGHLAEIVEPMHMLAVGEGKGERIVHDLADDFRLESATRVTASIDVEQSLLVDIAAMGPAAFHRSREELSAAAEALAADRSVSATIDVTVTVARRGDER